VFLTSLFALSNCIIIMPSIEHHLVNVFLDILKTLFVKVIYFNLEKKGSN
jgi:hypothetical protein